MTDMLINNVDIAAFGARLMTFNVSGTAVTNNTSAAGNLLRLPVLYGCTLAVRTITVALSFHPKSVNGSSRGKGIPQRLHASAKNITGFESEIIGKPVELFLPDGFWYSCLYTGSTPSEPDATGITDVTYTFSGIRHLPLVSEEVPASGMIYCLSNTKTAFRIIITTAAALESLTVNGITVNDLPANSELIIDSVNGLVTCNGVNKFKDTDLIDFPYLDPGSNIISCSSSVSGIKVEYTPIYM